MDLAKEPHKTKVGAITERQVEVTAKIGNRRDPADDTHTPIPDLRRTEFIAASTVK